MFQSLKDFGIAKVEIEIYNIQMYNNNERNPTK